MIEAEQRTYEHILFEQDGNVAYVTMNRPDKRNALSLAHMLELKECFRSIGESEEAQVVILRANGPAFCAGHDLSEMVGRDPEFYRRLFDVCTELMTTIQAIPQPVIASGPRHRYRRRLPTRSDLRPRSRYGGGPLRHAGGQDRALLLHPDGRPEPLRRPEKSYGDAADRRLYLRRRRSSPKDWSTGWFRRRNSKTSLVSWRRR